LKLDNLANANAKRAVYRLSPYRLESNLCLGSYEEDKIRNARRARKARNFIGVSRGGRLQGRPSNQKFHSVNFLFKNFSRVLRKF